MNNGSERRQFRSKSINSAATGIVLVRNGNPEE